MLKIDPSDLAGVRGGESFRDVMHALHALPEVPVDQTYGQTLDFIANHPFFHRGVMNLPIGGGKHFRNVPFVGPSQMIKGKLHRDPVAVAKGREVTRATWDAP